MFTKKNHQESIKKFSMITAAEAKRIAEEKYLEKFMKGRIPYELHEVILRASQDGRMSTRISLPLSTSEVVSDFLRDYGYRVNLSPVREGGNSVIAEISW